MFLRTNPSQIFKINAMVTFHGSLELYTFFDLPGTKLKYLKGYAQKFQK